jgi:xylose isomerase
MAESLKISISPAGFFPGGDGYCTAYRNAYSFEKFLEAVASIPGVSGIDTGFPFPAFGLPDDVHKVGELVRSYGLRIANLMVDTYIGSEWKFGTFTAPDPKVRAKGIQLHQQLMELAEALDAGVAGVWLAHDGFDYILQVDYQRHWDMLVDGFREVTAHRPNVKAAIEYKLKDPRHFCHISNMGVCLMLIEEVGAPNLGVLQDVGHTLIARENMAEAAVLAMRKGRLFHMHWNENYRAEDIDLIAGSVHVWETIECLYWLDKMGYDGWMGFDVISKREDSVRHITESVAAIRHMMDIAHSLDEELLAQAQREQDAVTALQHLRQKALR